MSLNILEQLRAAQAGQMVQETPKAEAPKAEAPKAEAPKAEAPSANHQYTVGAKYYLQGSEAEYLGVHTDGRNIFKKDGNMKKTLIAPDYKVLDEVPARTEEFDSEFEEDTEEVVVVETKPVHLPAVHKNDIAPLAQTATLDDLREMLAKIDPDLVSEVEEQMEERDLTMDITFPEIQMLREVEGFEVKNVGEKPFTLQKFIGYIVEHGLSRSKFPKDSQPGDKSKPECWSKDGKKPFGGKFYSDTCHSCRFNEWGSFEDQSKPTNRKACGERKELFVLIPSLNKDVPFKLSLSGTQKASVDSFLEAIRQSGQPFSLLPIEFNPVSATKNGFKINNIELVPVGGLPAPAEIVHILKVRKMYKSAMLPGEAPAKPLQLPFTAEEDALPCDLGETGSLFDELED